MKTNVAFRWFALAVILVSAACGKKAVTVEEVASSLPPKPQWKVIGPGGGGGQFIPTVNPADSNNVFVRCDMTGAYVTYDGAKTWRMFNLRTVVQDFEFDPGDPNTVYASNTALWRSEDRGASWHLVWPAPGDVTAERMLGDHSDQFLESTDGMPDGSIDLVRVDPADSRRIYLGLTPPSWHSRRNAGPGESDSARVMVSTDRGANWRLLSRVYGRSVLAIVPGAWDKSPDEVLVVSERGAVRLSLSGAVEAVKLPVERIMAADCGHASSGSRVYILAGLQNEGGNVSGGVYRSDDRGKSWQPANGGLVPPGVGLPRLATLATCESNPEFAYLSVRSYPEKDSTRWFGIMKTVDGGASWQWSYQAGDDGVVGGNHGDGWMDESYGPSWAGAPISLGVSPTDPDICYASDYGCTQRTLDGGKWWEEVYSRKLPDGSWTSRGLDVTTCYGVHFDPFDSLHYFISYTDVGLFQTKNDGASWTQSIQGVPRPWINTCYWLTFDPEVKGRIWSVWANCHDLPRPKMFGGDFGRFGGGVAVSSDGGESWSATTSGLPENTVCTHVLLDPDSPSGNRTLYVCGFGKGVFKSTDDGASWKLMNRGLDTNLNAWRMTRLPDGTLYLLVARGGHEGRGGYIDGGLYVSRDGAGHWKPVLLPKDVNAPNDLVVDPADPNRMYLSCWPWPKDGREHAGGLLRTEDGGKTWLTVFDEDAHVYAAAVDPENPSNVVLNTFDSAAFRSEDYGASWTRIPGYGFKWGHRPVFDPHHPGMLFLTTFGGSVFYGPSTGVPGAPEDIVERQVLRW